MDDDANPGNAPDDDGGGAAPNDEDAEANADDDDAEGFFAPEPEAFPPPPLASDRVFLAEDRDPDGVLPGVFPGVFPGVLDDARPDAPTWNAGADAAAASKKADAAEEGVAAAGGGGVNVNVNVPAPASEDDRGGDGAGGDGRVSVPVPLAAPFPADAERLADAPLARRWFPADLDGDFPALNDKFSIPRSIVVVVSNVVSACVVDPNVGENGAKTPARNVVAEKGVVV